MSKAELIALLVMKKDEKMAAVGSEYDLLIEAANALDLGGDVEALQAEIVELNAQIAAKDSLIAEKNAKLEEVNQMAKAMDAAIPDAQ